MPISNFGSLDEPNGNRSLPMRSIARPSIPAPLRIHICQEPSNDGSGPRVRSILIDHGLLTPGTPLTPHTPVLLNYEEIQSMTDKINSLEADKAELIREKQEDRAALGVARTRLAETNILLERERGGRLAVVPTTPLHHTPIIPATPRTPHTPSGRFNFSSGRPVYGTGSSRRVRHRRTQTPTTPFRPSTYAQLAPQDDRGLLNDFFGDIKKWATEWVVRGLLSGEEIDTILTADSVTAKFLDETASVDGSVIIEDEGLRAQLLTSVVSCYIILFTMSEDFLHRSQWPESPLVQGMVKEIEDFDTHDPTRQDSLLRQQKELYTWIKARANHKDVREATSLKQSEHLIAALGDLLRKFDSPTLKTADRDRSLQELFIKGYRIGFRMRMENAKWLLVWPAASTSFSPDTMVNESHLLHGDTAMTYERVVAAPQTYGVRFALSPTVTKLEYSGGSEKTTVVHHAMVLLEKKPEFSFVGAERCRHY